MVFSSFIFLWIFLPVVFVVNYFIGPKYSNIFLLAASCFFYAWGEPHLVFFMLFSIVVNWLIGRNLGKGLPGEKLILLFGIVFDLAALVYFKYAGFGIRILNFFLGSEYLPVPDIQLPIGISFFTFQEISYILDVYNGKIQSGGGRKLINAALYISFFPQLIAGPIVRYKEIDEQISCRKVTKEGAAFGFRRFIYGLSKKVLVANVLGKGVDSIFSVGVLDIGGKTAWLASVLYMFQIYYDFSGYSDMAAGLGRMFGFQLPENFNYPYLSSSIQEFWQRWHISLGAWFKEYVYIPLGGNRKGRVRTYIHLSIVFFLTGLWHGASMNFVIWGMYHGFFSILERSGFRNILDKNKAFSHIYAFLVVNFGWVIFRSPDFKDALFFVKRMLMPWLYMEYDSSIWEYINNHTVFILICAVLGMGIIQKGLPGKIKEWWRFSVLECIYCAGMLVLCFAAIAGDAYHPFIYFQF